MYTDYIYVVPFRSLRYTAFGRIYIRITGQSIQIYTKRYEVFCVRRWEYIYVRAPDASDSNRMRWRLKVLGFELGINIDLG